jgi:hypothetical protein
MHSIQTYMDIQTLAVSMYLSVHLSAILSPFLVFLLHTHTHTLTLSKSNQHKAKNTCCLKSLPVVIKKTFPTEIRISSVWNQALCLQLPRTQGYSGVAEPMMWYRDSFGTGFVQKYHPQSCFLCNSLAERSTLLMKVEDKGGKQRLSGSGLFTRAAPCRGDGRWGVGALDPFLGCCSVAWSVLPKVPKSYCLYLSPHSVFVYSHRPGLKQGSSWVGGSSWSIRKVMTVFKSAHAGCLGWEHNDPPHLPLSLYLWPCLYLASYLRLDFISRAFSSLDIVWLPKWLVAMKAAWS